MTLRFCRNVSSHLGQLLLRGKAQSKDSVGPAVSPLAKLLGRLGKCHVGCDGAVDDHLLGQKQLSFKTLLRPVIYRGKTNIPNVLETFFELGLPVTKNPKK